MGEDKKPAETKADGAAPAGDGKEKKKMTKEERKKEEEMSSEDIELRDRLALMVERVKDTDQGVIKSALDSMRQEIREATSSMTSVPKPLKFLRPHYGGMKEHFETMMESDNKFQLSDVLSVLGMTMAGSGKRESLHYKLLGTKGAVLDTWGFEYVKNLSGEIGQEWEARTAAGKGTDDLKALVEEIVPFNMKNNGEPDACDLLMEVDMLPSILEHATETNFSRLCLYLTNCANYVPEPEDAMIFKVVYSIFRKVDKYPEALRIAIRLNDQKLAQEVFDACSDEMTKKQLCFLLARHGTINIETEDDDLLAIMGNSQLSEHFLSLARDLDVFEAKTPEDIYKTHLTEQRAGATNVDSARANLASTFVNAFVNAGFGHDTLMTGDSKWIYKNKEHGTMSAAASLGMILLWDVDSGLSQIDKFTYSDSEYIRAGASLAVGIVSANVRSECDPALALMSDKVDAENSTVQRIGAALGLGLAYAGTQKEDILDILTPVIADPATPIELFSLAALSLGMVYVGTGKADIAETIMQGMLEREAKVLEDTMSRFACLGLGLLFLGLQEAADVTMEALKAVPGQIGQYCSFTVETCAYAGSGNVMKVQKLFGVCAEHLEENNSHQAVALLGIALIAQGEEIGAEMSARSFEHMLQYGEVNLRRVVPLAVAMLHLSNPKPQVIDMLSKLSHDGDSEVAQGAIMALGLVGAGTNNSRIALLLRQLSTYYGKDTNNVLFVVRIAQGLLHMGKGLMTLSLLYSDRLITSPTALAGAMAVMHACLDFKGIILGKYHYLLFLLSSTMQPRMLVTVDEELKPLPVSVRVGQAVDVVGQAGKPKTITGFATHTTPVLLAYDQRAELATEQYLPLTSVLEGFVILKENPEWKAPGEPSPSKKKDDVTDIDDEAMKKLAMQARNVRPDQRMYDK
eukprot:CAMPEP_0206230098 /NCGR_PEP_ID=MMETSP0047_2-20121206/10060_1 /ASSEMBLY_ACC=CAM_ASM_000192 /TAXON_ID=195065 /ORGANISM="Chroomonas mesostigmatica_cf, Strain CCMP1168" /LENGTH=915 /DNA_ID=CAMNT_0053653463 /DNA_START=69 /DNA_END=2816 /DNA_ORIENTATION=-